VHKQNGGLSSARNAGLEVATGEFVGFVDGDDQIEPEMVRRLLEILKKTGANIAFCGIIIDRDGVLFPMPLPEKFWKRNNYRLEGIDALAAMLRQDVNISVWNKLYTRSIIGGTRFDESAWVLEDMPFNFEVFGGGVSIVYLPEPMYRYIQRSSSLSRLGSNAAFKLAVRLKVLERLAEKSSNMPMAVRSAAREFCCRNVFHAVIRMGGARELRGEVGALIRFAWREWGIGIVPPVAALACEMIAREAVRANARVRAKIAAARPRAKGR
jgi:glycosyltransferase involved in cell wall biosynthesis